MLRVRLIKQPAVEIREAGTLAAIKKMGENDSRKHNRNYFV